MAQVRRIDWTFRTAGAPGAGTDSPVSLEMFRDGHSIVRVWDERGETLRLDLGEVATRGWTFEDPDRIGRAVSGVAADTQPAALPPVDRVEVIIASAIASIPQPHCDRQVSRAPGAKWDHLPPSPLSGETSCMPRRPSGSWFGLPRRWW